MKRNLHLFSGMIIGSLLTLLVIFFFKPTLLTANKSAITNNTSKEIPANTELAQTLCNDDCIDKIIKDLIDGTNLSYEFGVRIREKNAKKVAKKIQAQPETIAKIESTLRSLKGQDDRDAILFTFSYLPIEQLEKFTQRLINSENVQDRSDALSMVYHIAEASDKTISTLEHVIKSDINDELAIDAVQILYGIYPAHDGSAAQQRLNKILYSERPNDIKSSALQTKANFFETNDEIKQDIIKALTSPDERFKQIGIQVLDNIMNRQSNGNAAGDWRSDNTLRQSIESIANNKSAAPFTRVEALNLMRRHYDQGNQ